MITRLSTALSALLLCLCFSRQPMALAQQPQLSQLSQNRPQVSEQFHQHVNMLNELSERRLGNTFFTNEQSIFYGAQVGFVNAGTGNLTFARRDLVTVGRMPIVMARVYDSSLIGTGVASDIESDFSLGWQLSLAQTIKVMDNGTLLYRDDSAVLNTFVPATVGYKINPAQNSDIKFIGFNNQGLIQIDYLTGWRKHFQKLGSKYRLVKIADNNANQLTLAYRDNRLSSITAANHRAVMISRDEAGRIVKITDDISRSVRYQYDKNQLVSVNDLADNHWQYQYYGNQLLHHVIDPLGQKAATFKFGKNHKAKVVKIRAQKHRYKYRRKTTRITDENDNITTLVQNDKGITTSITNAEGFTSSIVLNDSHQITELWHNGQQQAHITYDDRGRPSQYDINGKPTALEQLTQDRYQQFSYQYDSSGRVVAIGDNDKTHIRYGYDGRGNLILHQQADFTRAYQYSANGDVIGETETLSGQAPVKTSFSYSNDGLLTSLSKLNKTTHFAYNTVGKLNNVTFPDGQNHQYAYDDLGFRRQTKRSDNSQVNYFYNSLGNLKKSIKTAVNQDTITENHNLNAQNQLVASQTTGHEALTVKYSAKGQPQSTTRGNKTSTYQYDKLDRLISVDDSEHGLLSHQYQPGESDIRLQLDDRTRPETSHQSKVGGHNQSQSQLHYTRMSGSPWQAVVWDAAQAKLLVASPETLNSADGGYQSSKQRRRLYNAIALNQWSQHSFDKASNSFFTPPEYSAIGCEIEDERCYGVMNYVRLTMPANITVGDTARFVARAGGNSACEAEYFFSFQNYHATNTSGVFDVPVTSAGSFTAVVTAECCSYMKFVTKPVSVASAPGECPKSMDGFSNACGCTTDEPATTFTPSLASVSRQTATEPLGECVAGRVDSANVNIDIDVRCDGGKYRAVLKTLTGKYEFQAGLLPGQQEVTGVESKGNTTKANSYDQIIELQALGFCPGAWYMKQAIVRHEQVHERHLEPSLENIASLIETSIERLTVDATAGKTKLQAIAEIKKLSGYSKVESDATVVWDDEYSTAIRFDHTNGSTAAAEHQVVKPMAESICAYAKMHNWDSHTACQSTTQVFDSQGK